MTYRPIKGFSVKVDPIPIQQLQRPIRLALLQDRGLAQN